MTITRPAARAAAPLVHDLLDGDAVRADAAGARLLVLGPRAVPHLLDALDHCDERGCVRILKLLELLPAARRIVAAVDAAAARGGDVVVAAVAVWASWLAAEDRALATLAYDRLARVALAPDASRPARRAAVDAVRGLGDAASVALLQRVGDADPGLLAVEATSNPELPNRAQPADAADAEEMRRLIAESGGTRPLSDLHRALERAREREMAAPGEHERQAWLAARAAAHQALAARGSTVALYDLRELLERLDAAPPVGIVAALRDVGDTACLDAIAKAWTRSADEWTHEQLQAAFVAICERHQVTRRHAVARRLTAKQHPLAASIPAASRGARPS